MNARPTTPPTWHSLNPLGHLTRMLRDPIGLFSEARDRYGDLVTMRALHHSIVAVSGPQEMHQIFVSQARKYDKSTVGYRTLSLLLSTGLVTAQGETWKRHRKVANPAFHQACLAGFAETMNVVAADAVAGWTAAPDQPRDLAQDMAALTLRIAGLTLFDVDLSDRSSTVSGSVTEALAGFDRLIANPLPFAHHLPTAANRRFQAALGDMDAVVHDIIAQRRAATAPRADLLGMLMDAVDDDGGGLSDLELRDEVVTMLMAGHETTANALAWTLFLLGRHPEIAARAAAEARRVAPSGPVTFAHLGQLPLLKGVFHEALRLYPPIWMQQRRCVTGDLLGGYRIPPETLMLLPIWVLHRHPDLWDRPDTFAPERWAPDGPGAPKGAFLPFSTGARKCIGDRFAETEALIVLVHLLRDLEIELAPDCAPVPEPSVTLRPGGGVPGRLVPRP